MYPDQQQPSSAPLPYDYLNQIAPQGPKKGPFSFGLQQIVLLGLGLVVLISIVALVINVATADNKQPLERLSARLSATETIVNDSQVSLKSSKLRSLNSNLKIFMTNTNRDMAGPLKTAGINGKISASVIAKESTTELATRLEDARLNAVFDRTYAREMAYQLGTTLTLMTQIYNSTNSVSTKDFLKTAYDSLKPTQEGFAAFSTAE